MLMLRYSGEGLRGVAIVDDSIPLIVALAAKGLEIKGSIREPTKTILVEIVYGACVKEVLARGFSSTEFFS